MGQCQRRQAGRMLTNKAVTPPRPPVAVCEETNVKSADSACRCDLVRRNGVEADPDTGSATLSVALCGETAKRAAWCWPSFVDHASE